MAGRLSGKVALVTAAGQGIGRAVAERLMAEGAEVHACDLSGELLAGLGAASAEAVDCTDWGAVEDWVGGRPAPDAVVHCVGWVHHGSVEECSPEDWRRSAAITLDSAFYVTRAAVPRMKARGGSVTCIASVASSVKGLPNRTAYGAHKAGVIGLMKACAADYVARGLRFNAVNPGTVDSPSLRARMAALAERLGSAEAAERYFLDRQPTGRLGSAEEIAGICAYLASDEAKLVTGQAINIDGGMTI